MTLRYLSVCSGIEAATVAWHPLGWTPAAFAEIEAFPRAVLQHHYSAVPLHGDFTTIGADDYGPIDLLVGGTPCQSFSIAGLRGGLADDRGNLALEFLRLADRKRPRWILWENVPGVFSSLSHDAPDPRPPAIDLDAGDGPEDGEEVVVEDSYDAIESHALGCFLAGLQELGYGAAYRVLDAQYAGVPQRRRRVFVVGHLGDWRRAAAVLFERHSLQGHPAPRRETREAVAALTANGVGTCGAEDNQGQAGHLIPSREVERAGVLEQLLDGQVAHSLRGEGFDASEDGTGRGTPLVAVERVADTLTSNGDAHSDYRDEKGLVAFSENQQGAVWESDTVQALNKGGGKPGQGYAAIRQSSAVRRLTPVECERLQGFPDNFTQIPWRGKPAAECPDGPRYKALGNSMAVPVMRWIGSRIARVDALASLESEAA